MWYQYVSLSCLLYLYSVQYLFLYKIVGVEILLFLLAACLLNEAIRQNNGGRKLANLGAVPWGKHPPPQACG